MTDIKLVLDGPDYLGDFVVENNDLGVDDGLETAVLISLFTDARSPDRATLPDGSDDPRGWWGDSVANEDNDQTGSLLWLLGREKQTTRVLRRAEQYASEALQWMIDDRVASSVSVEAEIVRHGVLGLSIGIHRPAGDAIEYRYEYAWEQQAARRA